MPRANRLSSILRDILSEGMVSKKIGLIRKFEDNLCWITYGEPGFYLDFLEDFEKGSEKLTTLRKGGITMVFCPCRRRICGFNVNGSILLTGRCECVTRLIDESAPLFLKKYGMDRETLEKAVNSAFARN